MGRKKPTKSVARSKKPTRSQKGGKRGASHSAKPDDLRDRGPAGEVVVRTMTDADRQRFADRRRNANTQSGSQRADAAD